MNFLHLIILSIVQGITEFLPISSSAHLVLVPVVLDTPDQGLLMDVSVHIGTLLAVVVYLRRDILKALFNPTLLLCLFVATLPIVVAGFFMHQFMPEGLRSLEIIAAATLFFGIVLLWADETGGQDKTMDKMDIKTAVYIGLGQILALIPGTSRSGITMSVARKCGFNRLDAARFSLLLGVPTIAGAGLIAGIDLWQTQDVTLGADVGLAILFSFITALISIICMMKWLEKFSFRPFVIYRLFLGMALFAYVYLG